MHKLRFSFEKVEIKLKSMKIFKTYIKKKKKEKHFFLFYPLYQIFNLDYVP